MIYIIRHGQTVWNLEGRKQGQKDSPLTLKGIRQAEEISKILNNNIDNYKEFKIVISPQWRCQQFTSIICETTKIDFKNCILEENLREHCFGLWEGKTEEEIEEHFPGFLKRRYEPQNYWNYIVPMGESYELLANRVKKVLNKYKHKNIIFVCHEMVSKVMRGSLMNLEKEEILSLRHPQDCVYCYSNNKLLELKNV